MNCIAILCTEVRSDNEVEEAHYAVFFDEHALELPPHLCQSRFSFRYIKLPASIPFDELLHPLRERLDDGMVDEMLRKSFQYRRG